MGWKKESWLLSGKPKFLSCRVGRFWILPSSLHDYTREGAVIAVGSMNTFEFTILIWGGSLAAGFLGSLTGLGGGVVIVPLLTLVFGWTSATPSAPH